MSKHEILKVGVKYSARMELEDGSSSPASLNSPDTDTNKKRNRSSNFSSHEKNLLIHILEKYQEVIESKRNDKASLQEKERVWDQVREEFNELSMKKPVRTAKQLKVCYENLKRKIRKETRHVNTNMSVQSNNLNLEQQQPASDGDSDCSVNVSSTAFQGSSSNRMVKYRRNRLHNGITEARRKYVSISKLRRILLIKEIRLAKLCLEMQAKKSNLELQVEEAKLQYFQKKIKMLDNALQNA